jgi:hypothetical protein
MMLQSEGGYVLLETGSGYAVVRAPIFGELLVEWKSRADWKARPPDAPRWEMEVRQDIDALRGYRQANLVLGRYALTFWPWDVVRKWRLPKLRPASATTARGPEAGSEPPTPGVVAE